DARARLDAAPGRVLAREPPAVVRAREARPGAAVLPGGDRPRDDSGAAGPGAGRLQGAGPPAPGQRAGEAAPRPPGGGPGRLTRPQARPGPRTPPGPAALAATM